MPQPIDRLLATPMIRPRLPAIKPLDSLMIRPVADLRRNPPRRRVSGTDVFRGPHLKTYNLCCEILYAARAVERGADEATLHQMLDVGKSREACSRMQLGIDIGIVGSHDLLDAAVTGLEPGNDRLF